MHHTKYNCGIVQADQPRVGGSQEYGDAQTEEVERDHDNRKWRLANEGNVRQAHEYKSQHVRPCSTYLSIDWMQSRSRTDKTDSIRKEQQRYNGIANIVFSLDIRKQGTDL